MELYLCECCALVVANDDDSACQDYYHHDHTPMSEIEHHDHTPMSETEDLVVITGEMREALDGAYVTCDGCGDEVEHNVTDGAPVRTGILL